MPSFLPADSFLHSQFIEKLMTTLTSETVFLLTTFSNMTRSRVWKEEKWFIQAVALHLFEVSGAHHTHARTSPASQCRLP